jgi:pseudouridine synthase
VTSRNLDALAAAFAFSTTQRSVEETCSGTSLSDTRSSVSEPDDAVPTTYLGSGFRLVRCMPHLRRREADAAVSGGRVRVNGVLVKPSRRVVAGDVVTLDGKKMDWEPFANAAEGAIVGGSIGDDTSLMNNQSRFVYLKYHKPRGVTCTMEPSQKSSMLYALKDELKWLTETRRRWLSSVGDRASRGPVRVFPVGRLDRDSSGLVLLTDDGRVPEALLDPKNKAPKTYDVEVDRAVSDAAVQTLRDGVVIATTQQRDGIETVAPTLPCEVTRITPASKGTHGVDALRFVLREGRNRQIRKMCAAVGTEVTSLHRVSVGDVRLSDAPRGDATSALECGGVRALEGDELAALARDVAESVARKRDGAASAAKTRAPPPEGWGKRIRDGR